MEKAKLSDRRILDSPFYFLGNFFSIFFWEQKIPSIREERGSFLTPLLSEERNQFFILFHFLSSFFCLCCLVWGVLSVHPTPIPLTQPSCTTNRKRCGGTTHNKARTSSPFSSLCGGRDITKTPCPCCSTHRRTVMSRARCTHSTGSARTGGIASANTALFRRKVYHTPHAFL